jgi:hypothetical protein
MTDAGHRKRSAFSMTTVVMLVLVGVFSFSAMITLSTFAPDLEGSNGRAHALSRSAVGFAAAIELEQARGRTVTISRNEATGLRASLLVLTPPFYLDADTLMRIAGMRTLIILPKWSVRPHPTHEGWVQKEEVHPDTYVEVAVQDLVTEPNITQATGSSRPRLRFIEQGDLHVTNEVFQPGKISNLQTISAEDIEPVLTDEDGNIVLGHLADTDLYDTYVLADPDFLNTQGLANLDTARAGMRILDALHEPGEPIVFDVTLNGYARARNVMRLMFEPPFLGATLALAIAAGLLGWRAVAHKTPEVAKARAIALGKRALAENSAALIRLARREHSMGGRYADLIAAVTADQVGIAKKEVEDIPGSLDRIAAHGGVSQKFTELAAEAAGSQSPDQLVAAAKKLHSWNEEVVRATR